MGCIIASINEASLQPKRAAVSCANCCLNVCARLSIGTNLLQLQIFTNFVKLKQRRREKPLNSTFKHQVPHQFAIQRQSDCGACA